MKEEVKKLIAELKKEDIFEISNNLYNLCNMLNKCKEDTIFLRYIALRGYHTKRDFMLKHKIGHDTTLEHTINGCGDSIEALFKLKEYLYINDTQFYRYMENKIKDIENSTKKTKKDNMLYDTYMELIGKLSNEEMIKLAKDLTEYVENDV